MVCFGYLVLWHSTLGGYLMPNPIYIYMCVCVRVCVCVQLQANNLWEILFLNELELTCLYTVK